MECPVGNTTSLTSPSISQCLVGEKRGKILEISFSGLYLSQFLKEIVGIPGIIVQLPLLILYEITLI